MSLKTLAPHLATALPVTTVGPSRQPSILAFLESPLSCSSLLLATLMLSQGTGTQALNLLKPHIWGVGDAPYLTWGTSVFRWSFLQGSGLSTAQTTLEVHVTLYLSALRAYSHLVPPCLLPQNTDLLARSFLHNPRALPPAWGWWLATSTFPGRSGSPPREST